MRYFLIDKVTELVVGIRAQGIKNVTLSDDIVHDHFPDYPVMPGALIIEAASQLAGFLLEMTFNQEDAQISRALLAQVNQAKFYEVAEPGDRLEIEATIDSMLEAAATVSVRVQRDDSRIMTSRLMFVMKHIDSEPLQEQRRYLYRLWTRDLKLPLTIR
jgi:3-hydroxyacyl-[acyl-carrier-protein] dehydratase